ncbi:MAG TPA: anthranilate synthase component I family protein [bacterium]|nr:anthranilate synthase component I family protein [bacterium]
MTPQALAWGWLEHLPARPFTLLETAGSNPKKRFSLLAGEPLFVFEGRASRSSLVCGAKRWRLGLPPEQAFERIGKALAGRGGSAFWPLINAFGYEAGGRFEKLPRASAGSLKLPDWWAFLPGLWAWWDPGKGAWRRSRAGLDASTSKALARSLGLPARALEAARRAPEAAWIRLASLLKGPLSAPEPEPAPPRGALDDSMGKAGYCARVRAIQRHILDGDIYQANLAHHFETDFSGKPFDLYRRLTRINPSPMAAYVDLGAVQVVSASPERLFQVRGRQAETWPIAGTAARTGRPGERQALRRSAKDQAEHVMLVDLERNDLGRVCVPGTVRVPRFQVVHSYSHVHHLVSQVCGVLLPGLSLPQVLAAGFPGGSITGAPKIRCMEIIAALEGRARGWYTGSLGWWDPRRREADLNILIRTLFVAKGRAGAGVGAGIVLDSKPEAEWEETLAKAAALLSALGRTR